jgi:hypothetical protein
MPGIKLLPVQVYNIPSMPTLENRAKYPGGDLEDFTNWRLSGDGIRCLLLYRTILQALPATAKLIDPPGVIVDTKTGRILYSAAQLAEVKTLARPRRAHL